MSRGLSCLCCMAVCRQKVGKLVNFNMKYSFYRKNIRCKHHANYSFVLWQIIAESILAIFSFLSAVLLKRL